jgi:hypothetical protein
MFLVACSGGPGMEAPIDAPHDAGDASTDAPAVDARDAAVQCNTFANDAQPVALEASSSPPPHGNGGVIAPGKYHLTKFTVHLTMNGTLGTVRATAEITPQQYSYVSQLVPDMGAPTSTDAIFDIAPNGVMAPMTNVCPGAIPAPPVSYTATSTTLTVISTTTPVVVLEWTKQ